MIRTRCCNASLAVLLLIPLTSAGATAQEAVELQIASGGDARCAVVVAETAGEQTRKAAAVLVAETLPVTFRSGLEDAFAASGRWNLYFYVPLGTKVVGGYAATAAGRLLDADGKPVYLFEEMQQPGYFSVPVGEGQDGRLWKFERCSGARMLMTVPPYLAASADALLLPQEVVMKDAAATRAPRRP